MILIGSRALAHHGLLRKCVDWDFIGSYNELNGLKFLSSHTVEKPYSTILRIGDEIIEFSIAAPEDKLIKIDKENVAFKKVFGWTYDVPTIESLLAIKAATAQFLNREKHFEDINWIYKSFPLIKTDLDLYNAKRAEIDERVKLSANNKYQFFHKYHHVEKIEHDKLHDMISEMLFTGYPTYKLFVSGDTEVSFKAWSNLSHALKLSRFIEETLVLTLERWYIPKLMKHGVHNPKIKANFVHMSSVLCEHVLRGLKDEDEFMSQWGRDNREQVMLAVKKYAEKLISLPFPQWFTDELYRMRFK